MALVKLNSEVFGDIFRSALLVLAFWGLLSGLWPAIGGFAGQYAGAAEATTVHKNAGVVTAPWDTESAPSLSWIKVHVSVDPKTAYDVTVLIVAMNTRNIVVTNSTGFASAGDFLGISGGKGEGRDVTLTGSHGGPVRYRISVNIADSARLQNKTDADVDYSLTWEIQKLDPLVVLGGLLLFNMFFVTEYLLHVRREVRAVARRGARREDEGAEAPSAALGMPLGAPSSPPPVRAEPEGRGGFLGRFGREAEPQAPLQQPPVQASFDTASLGPPASMPPAAPPSRYAPAQQEAEPYAPPGYPPQYAPTAYAPTAYAPTAYAPTAYTPPEPVAPPPAPAFQAPVAAPPRTRAAAPAPPPPPPAAVEGQEPFSKVRCPQCKHIVPVFTAERPTPIRCPNCGKRGMLTK